MSFSTALSGLNAATADLNVKSNNIANVSTTGFKQSRAEFGDVFAVSAFGTSSKTAIGSGVVLSSVSQQFNQGNLEFTDNSLDLAISGEGFFAMAPTETSGEITYTRAGAFGINKDGFVVNSGGSFLRTFPVDANGNISATSMSAAKPLQLPASQGAPEATSELNIATNLPSNATPISIPAVTLVPGTLTTTNPITISDFSADQVSFQVDGTLVTLNADYGSLAAVASTVETALPGYTVALDATNNMVITGPTDAIPVISAYDGNVDGDVVVSDFVSAGTQTPGNGLDISSYDFSLALPSSDYTLDQVSFDISFDTGAGSATNTVTLNADYTSDAGVATEIQNQLNTAFGGGTFTVSEAAGVITIDTAANTANPISASNFTNPTGAITTVADFTGGTGVLGTAAAVAMVEPINPFDTASYSNSTSATVYDSLGNEHIVTTYYQKVDAAAATPAGTDNQWRMEVFIGAADIKQPSTPTPVGVAPNQLVQIGTTTTVQFNNDGSLGTISPADPVTLDMTTAAGTELTSGASDLTVALNLNGSTQNSGSFAVGALTVNGFPTGRLTGVDVSDDGLIRATYSNGQAVPIGKIALANFANVQALNKVGNTEWKETTDSGPVIAGEAATGSFGQIQSGALETSNVDLTKELVGLITAQRNFQANSKAIETNNTITQTIINIR